MSAHTSKQPGTHTYVLDYDRHFFSGDDLTILPVVRETAGATDATETVAGSSSQQMLTASPTPVLYGIRHSKQLELRRTRRVELNEHGTMAMVKYSSKNTDMVIETAAGTHVDLRHSYVQPTKDVEGTRIGCWIGDLPDGTKIRWEAATSYEDDAYSVEMGETSAAKSGTNQMIPKTRCVVDSAGKGSEEVLGELMRGNEIVRLFRGGELRRDGDGDLLGMYVLLGLLGIYERERAVSKHKAKAEPGFSFGSDAGKAGDYTSSDEEGEKA